MPSIRSILVIAAVATITMVVLAKSNLDTKLGLNLGPGVTPAA